MDDRATDTGARSAHGTWSAPARETTADAEGMAAWPRLYGRRARIGLIVPVSNTTNEAEFSLYAPDGVTTHTMRAPLHLDSARPDFERLRADTVERARMLAPAGCDIIAYGCTASSMMTDEAALSAAVTEATGLPMVTTFGSIVHALRTLGIRRLAVATPYVEALNAHEREHLGRHGFDVKAIRGLGIGRTPDEYRFLSRVPRAVLMKLVSDVMDEAGEVDGLLVSCTDLPTLDMIAVLEDAYGLPVVTANQATLWCVLRRLGLDEINLSLGQLFLRGLGRVRLS